MNRDERRERPDEIPPSVHRTGAGAAWLAPTDGARGGTWIGANAHGLALCLLNGYAPGESAAAPNAPSRGTLIPLLMDCADARSAGERLRELMRGSTWQSFCLIAADLTSTIACQWRDQVLSAKPFHQQGDWSMISSSSWEMDRVLAYREGRFQEWAAKNPGAPVGLSDLHLGQTRATAGADILMDREFSATRSITQVIVERGRIALHWHARHEHRVSRNPISLSIP